MVFLLVYIIFPLIISNVLHMLVVRFNMLPAISIPVSRTYFGKNKTWRGFLILPVFNSLCMGFLWLLFLSEANPNGFVAGFLFGLAYLIFELPNSFIKRKLGIAPGQPSTRYGFLMRMADRMDSSLGVMLLAVLIYKLSWAQGLYLFVLSIMIHALFSFLLYRIKVKKSF